jgi:hypothetical protein
MDCSVLESKPRFIDALAAAPPHKCDDLRAATAWRADWGDGLRLRHPVAAQK